MLTIRRSLYMAVSVKRCTLRWLREKGTPHHANRAWRVGLHSILIGNCPQRCLSSMIQSDTWVIITSFYLCGLSVDCGQIQTQTVSWSSEISIVFTFLTRRESYFQFHFKFYKTFVGRKQQIHLTCTVESFHYKHTFWVHCPISKRVKVFGQRDNYL